MKAVVPSRYGQPADVLETRDLERPTPKDGEVLIAVRRAAIHAGDWLQLTGRPYVFRLGTGLPRPRNRPLGHDAAGIVEAVGSKVTGFAPGDRVFGECRGTLAEFTAARAERIAHIPDGVTFDQAAAVPVSGSTALQGLRDQGKVGSGTELLVNGASGGVGSFAIQIGKALGAEVTGVCSTGKIDLVRSLGADHVIDYTAEDFTQGTGRYDVILDNAGNHTLRALRGALKPSGTLLPSNGTAGGTWFGPLFRILGAMVMSPFSRRKNRIFVGVANAADLDLLGTWIQDGTVSPVLEATYPIEQAADAFARIGSGHASGKIIIEITE